MSKAKKPWYGTNSDGENADDRPYGVAKDAGGKSGSGAKDFAASLKVTEAAVAKAAAGFQGLGKETTAAGPPTAKLADSAKAMSGGVGDLAGSLGKAAVVATFAFNEIGKFTSAVSASVGNHVKMYSPWTT